MPQCDDDSNLEIQLLSFDRPTELTELYYFLGMTTLQVTKLLSSNKKIVSSKILAYTNENNYLDEQTAMTFKTIGDFNSFFQLNSSYYISNCDLELEDEIQINSHDDGEVSILFHKDNSDKTIIDRIFEKFNLDKNLVDILKSKPGHYIAIDKENNVIADFENFDEYIKMAAEK